MKLIAFFAVLALLWLSLSPWPMPTEMLRALRMTYEHVALYAVFSVILLAAWPARPVVVVAGLLVMAVGLEALQDVVPVRAFETQDLVDNLIGVGLGALTHIAVLRPIWLRVGRRVRR